MEIVAEFERALNDRNPEEAKKHLRKLIAEGIEVSIECIPINPPQSQQYQPSVFPDQFQPTQTYPGQYFNPQAMAGVYPGEQAMHSQSHPDFQGRYQDPFSMHQSQSYIGGSYIGPSQVPSYPGQIIQSPPRTQYPNDQGQFMPQPGPVSYYPDSFTPQQLKHQLIQLNYSNADAFKASKNCTTVEQAIEYIRRLH